MALINDKKLLRLIRYAPLFLIVLFVLSINLIVIQDNREKSRQSIESLRSQVVDRQKENVKQHVELVVNEILYQKSLTRKLLKQQAKQRVEEAYAIADNIYTTNHGKSKFVITQLISEALRPIRFFDGRGYFFVFQMDGINVMHGLKPEIEGKSGWHSQDTKGTYILREHIELIEQSGEAFYRWWYPKPGEPREKEFEKIGFGKRFEPYNWFIGTGEYLADVEEDMKQQVLEWIGDYSYGTGGYIFIADKDGTILSHRETQYIGRKLADINVTPGLTLEGMIRLTELGGGFARYRLPALYGSNEMREKISYVQGIHEWGWLIGTGFNVEEFESYLAEQEAILAKQNHQELVKVLSLSALLTLLITLTSLLLSNSIARRFKNFQKKINSDFNQLADTKNKMQHMAQHDSLTGLPNRNLLIEKIDEGLAYAQEKQTELAVMFVDLDDFKKINDLYGHSSGDKLLEAISRKFETLLGSQDVVSRFGGDEFIFCFPDLLGMKQASMKAAQIKQVFDEQFVIDGKILTTNCSIGVSMFPEDSKDAETLIRKADIVLYKSKASCKGEVMFYDQNINEQVRYDYLLEEELRRAIIREEITVHYQPQIDVSSERMVSVEALARWHNDRLGQVSPIKFIAAAESIGLIHDIGCFVFRKACEDILMVSPNGETAIRVSINISPVQLMEQSFAQDMLCIIEEVGIDLERITFEITENVLIDDVDKVTPILQMLRGLGFGISLDDFGTGYSSLSYLNSLPISEIKIDRCFVDKILDNEQSNTLVRAIIAIGESCKMSVVAEGVETQQQYIRLISYGCNLVQGYYIDKPLSIEKLAIRERGLVSA